MDYLTLIGVLIRVQFGVIRKKKPDMSVIPKYTVLIKAHPVC